MINVTNLDEGERFWSAVSGLSPESRHGLAMEFSVLNGADAPDGQWILLQRVPDGQTSSHSGTHVDFRVDDVAVAVRAIEALGGVVVKPPALYPAEAGAYLEWAVMRDPFGNEFCVIRWPLH